MSSTYPIEPGVCFTRPDTPSLPLPPTPTGQLTEVAIPTFSLNSSDIFDK